MDETRIRNLQGLLRWSASQESGEAVDPSNIDPEKRAYLEQVMASMTSGSVDEMYRIFQIMQLDEGGEDDAAVAAAVQAKLEALEALQDLIEDIDVAGDFVKIGGVGICYAALSHPHEPIRMMAITCLAAASQNNPSVQDHLFTTGALGKFTAIVTAPESSPQLREKGLRGLSCLVRGDGVGHITEAFIRSKGGTVLAELLGRPDSGDGVITKAAYLVASLAKDFPRFRNVVKPSGVLDALVAGLAKTDDDTAWEQSLRALFNCSDGKPATALYLQQNTDLVAKLTARDATIAARPAEDQAITEEEASYSAKLRVRPKAASASDLTIASNGTDTASPPLAIAAPPVSVSGVRPFIPSDEWQAIQPGQAIPGGLETRMDLHTGVNYARMSPKV